jgi:3-hydroxy-9,10-secoandrosta-1,3,5(10)-triene-9,17-dione monooxygenase
MEGSGADIDRRKLVARAAALVPELRANVPATREGRRVADANVAAMADAGLFRVLQPRRWGGLEADMRTHLEVVSTIAEGCSSSSWILGVLQIHSWLLAQFSDAAQADVYGEDADARIAAVLAPRGQARRVEDGFELSGFWPFASGCNHARWLILGATVEGEEPQLAEGLFLVPTDAVENMDDWNVGGLRGTGSHSVRCEGVFVPDHRHVSISQALTDSGPGRDGNPGPLYRAAGAPALVLALTGSALGAAEMAYASFVERLPGRAVAYMDGLQQDHWTATHLQLGEARTKIDVARLLLSRAADDIDEWSRSGSDMPLEIRARTRADCSWGVRQCLEAVETLYIASGGSGLANSSLIQLAQQDLHAINMHGILILETNLDIYGRVILGQDPGTRAV